MYTSNEGDFAAQDELVLAALSPTEVAVNREAWCVALESGDYPQTTGRLRAPAGYCCLGVVEELRGARWKRHEPGVAARDLTADEAVDDRANALARSHRGVEYFVVNQRVRLLDPVTNEERRRVGFPDAASGTVLSGPAQRWLGVYQDDPYVVARVEREWRVETLATLNDRFRFTLPMIAAVVRDQSPDWSGESHHANIELDRRIDERRPAPAYAEES